MVVEKHTFWHKTIRTEENSQTSWKPKGKVWFQHNDDSKLGKEDLVDMSKRDIELANNFRNRVNALPEKKQKRYRDEMREIERNEKRGWKKQKSEPLYL